jgi:hypothetical protein
MDLLELSKLAIKTMGLEIELDCICDVVFNKNLIFS